MDIKLDVDIYINLGLRITFHDMERVIHMIDFFERNSIFGQHLLNLCSKWGQKH